MLWVFFDTYIKKDMVMYANEYETKKKTKITWNKKLMVTYIL